MIKTIFLIWTHPASTQDPGWVGASLASITPHAFPMIIKPDLNCLATQDPSDWQIVLDKIPELATYRILGLAIDPDSLILAGNVWNDFSTTHALLVSTLSKFGDPKRILKRMQPVDSRDMSRFLARQIERRLRKKKASTAIIEVSVSPSDPQSVWMLLALQVLATETSARFKAIVVSGPNTNQSDIARMTQAAHAFVAQTWIVQTGLNKPAMHQTPNETNVLVHPDLIVPMTATVFKWRDQFISALQKKYGQTCPGPVNKPIGLDSIPGRLFGFGFVSRPFDF